MKRAVIVAVTVLCTSHSAQAQTTVADSGSRIRIAVAEDREKATGTLVSISADTLVYLPEFRTARTAVAMSKVQSLEVGSGIHGSGTAVVVGAGLGGLAGVGITALLVAGSQNGGDGPPASLALVPIGAILFVGGMAAGALIGSHHTTEIWSPICPASGDLGVLVGLRAHGGLTIGLTMPFDASDVFASSSDSMTVVAEAPAP